MPVSPSQTEEYVRVICSYTYKPDNSVETITLNVGEEYSLIKKVNEVWWYVQKNETSIPFYVPANYVQVFSKGPALNVGGGGKTTEAGSTTSTKTKLAPTPKPRVTKMSSEDEAVRELDLILEKEDSVPMEIQVEKPDGSAAVTENPLASKKEAEKALNSQTVEVKSVSGDVGMQASSLQTSQTPAPKSPERDLDFDDETNYVNLEVYQQMVKERSAESETSDYRSGDSKGGSRESLESKSCDTDSTGAKEELERPDSASAESMSRQKGELMLPAKPEASKSPKSSTSGGSDYVNIEVIQESIHGARGKPSETVDGKHSPQEHFDMPPGWKVEEEKGQKIFVNTANGEKWKREFDRNKDRNYFYNISTNETVWNLTEASSLSELQRFLVSDRVSSAVHSAESAAAAASSNSDKTRFSWMPGLLSNTPLLHLASRKSKGMSNVEKSIAEVEPPPADLPPLEPLPLRMVQKQGQLSKAKVEESGKKSKKPSWSQSYAVLAEHNLYLYKDQKMAAGAKAKAISSLGKPEAVLPLKDAMLSTSPDEKKKEILVLSLSGGTVYLLHNENEETLQHWKQSLENNITVLTTTPIRDNKDLELMPLQPEAVFGSSLASICEREKSKIPRFIHECLVAVEKRGLDVDGIYRVSGNQALVQKIRQLVDQNEFYDLNSSSWDIHAVTGALKLFFRDLAEPLFTFAFFDEFLNAFRIQDRGQKIKAYRDVIKKLPPVHVETMKELFKHLNEVIRHSTVNRMQPQALAIVFGPTLLWPESKSKDLTLAAAMVHQGQVVEFILTEFRAIFL